MTDTSSLIENLKTAMAQQKARLQDMLSVLEEELEAVRIRDGKKLVEVSKNKETLLNDIKKADNQFNNENTIQTISSTPDLIQLKGEITAVLEECQQKNEVIYLAATQNQIAVEEVKRLLIGGSKNTTYDAYGQKQNSNRLGKSIKA